MSRKDSIDVRWGFGVGILLGFAGAVVFRPFGYELFATAGLCIMLSGAAIAVDYRNAANSWLKIVVMRPSIKMSPHRWARLNGGFVAAIGFVWMLGSIVMLALGESPS